MEDSKSTQQQASLAIDEDGPILSDGRILYFAIGSMINPTSINMRNVFPEQSFPAVLNKWAIKFTGSGGMATAVYDGESSFHGVVHVVTPEEMEILDKIESSYDRVPAEATLYDGRTIQVYVYSRLDSKKQAFKEWKLDEEHPPSERYVDIITRGCKHYCVKQEYIDWLNSLEVTPRKKPEEYSKFPVPENPSRYSSMFVKLHNGEDGKDLVICMNSKVLRHKDRSHHSFKWNRKHGGNTSLTHTLSTILYEPAFGDVPAADEDGMSDAHKAWVEDMMYNFQGKFLECIGVFDRDLKDRSDVVKRHLLPKAIMASGVLLLAKIIHKVISK